MNLEMFLKMQNELLLVGLLLAVLIGEIITSQKSKVKLINVTIIGFALVTLIGFIYQPTQGSIFGGMFRTNALIQLLKNGLNVGVLIILMQSAGWLKESLVPQKKSAEFFMLMFSSVIGLNFMISSGDFLMFYVALELSTLPVAALASYNAYKRQSAEAGIKLILSATLASGLALFGISFLYGATGALYFDDMANLLQMSNLTILGLVFFFAGLSFKVSLVPFHFWTADVYEGSPINVTSYLSVISKGAAVFIMMFILFNVFKAFTSIWQPMLYGVAIATMFVGNLFALRQQNLKRFLAFSSVAQAGFMLLGILNGGVLGATSVVYFVLVYMFSNLGAFGVVQAISHKTGKENMKDYEGLYRTNPLLSLIMMLGLFSLAGIPPVAGFFGKFFLFTAAAGKGYYILVFIAVVNATISLYYYLKVIRAMFLRVSDNPIPYFKNDIFMRLGLVTAAAGILVLGLYSPLFEYVQSISNLIFN
jgi:NADH-quinone oxidoreductase subunit N